ncbi:MAG: hypothetical protein DHS20C18_29420 [Saprospiraceae bacterium]|nr:MAG: hypothetical protein DHS20C18_29420 [Saprospiraceae bacterium]
MWGKFNELGNYIEESIMREEGTPAAEDFHDSEDTVPGGNEQFTGDNSLNAAGTNETPNSENGTTEIVEGNILAPGGSMGSKASGKVYSGGTQFSKSTDSASKAVNNARKAYKEYQKENGETRKVDTTRRIPFAGDTIFWVRPIENQD